MDLGPEMQKQGPEASIVSQRRVNRQSLFRGSLDGDEAALDNGDDSNVIEIRTERKEVHELGEEVEQAHPADAAVPVSGMDEKYMPAIMTKLMQMREEMAKIKVSPH